METIEPTRKIDDYILGPALGKGFLGHVRVANKIGDTKKYAIKYIKLKNQNAKAALLQTLRQECLLKKFNHPNILHIYSANANGVYEKMRNNEIERTSVLYLVLQLARTGDLFDFITCSGGLSERIARLYFNQILAAVEYIHSIGVAHRDIKPENVLLDQNYNALITDFGFSKNLSELGFITSNPVNRVGTERCMSPELFANKPHSPTKDDLFALGYLLFMLVARHPPFLLPTSTNEHYKLLMENRIKDYWSSIDALHPPFWCSDEFKHLVTIMLSADMTIRPSISEIKAHPWTSGELPTTTEVITEFERRQLLAIEYQKKEAQQRKLKKQKQKESGANKSNPGNYLLNRGEKKPIERIVEPKKIIKKLGNPKDHKPTILMSQEDPNDIEAVLSSYFVTIGETIVSEIDYKVLILY